MPSVQLEQFKRVTKLLVCTDGGTGDTTLSADHAKGATTLNVAAGGGTPFATGDVFRVGAGEDQTAYVVSSSTANTVVIAAPGLKRAYVSGEVVVEQVADQMGPIRSAGYAFRPTRETSDEFSADQRLPFVILRGYGSLRADFEFAALTLHNLAFAVGAPRTKVLGAGTAADPLQFTDDGASFGSLSNVNVIIEGVLNDDTPIRVECYGVNVEYVGRRIPLTRGVLSGVPVGIVCGGAVIDYSASPFTGTITYVATNADVLDGLNDFGYWTPATVGPLSTTTTTATAVGGNTVSLTDATNLVAGDWFSLGVGNRIEFHQVESVVALAITTRSRFLRVHPIGTAAVRQASVTLASLSTDGVVLEFNGAQSEVRTGLRDMAAGLRNGTVALAFAFGLTSFKKAALAIATGSAIPAGDVIELLGNLGATNVAGLFSKGLMQGGKTLWVNAWGNIMDLSATEMTFTNVGDPPIIPIRGRPTSGFQVLVFP